MGAVFVYQLKRFVRDRALVVWPFVFPLILTVIFMQMFAGVSSAAKPAPVPLGVVEDEAYAAAPGLDALVGRLSDPDSESHYADVTAYGTADEAEAAARAGDTIGYLAVEGGRPSLHVTVDGNQKITSVVLRRALDNYEQTIAQQREILASGAPPEALAGLGDHQRLTTEVQVTPEGSDMITRYYFSLLAFTAGIGMLLSSEAVKSVMATSGPLGARRTLAGIPRWRVLAGALGASWLCIALCMTSALVFMVTVADISFGPHAHLTLVVILASSLTSCAAGAVIGTSRRLKVGMIPGVVALLSLFTGLYGTGSQQLADAIETHVPFLSWINPLWQSTHGFYSLFYYDSLAPFVRSCAALTTMSALFFVVAAVRMRRMSYDHL